MNENINVSVWWVEFSHSTLRERARAELAARETYAFLQASDLFPGLHVFAPRLQELLVGQVKGLTDG